LRFALSRLRPAAHFEQPGPELGERYRAGPEAVSSRGEMHPGQWAFLARSSGGTQQLSGDFRIGFLFPGHGRIVTSKAS
jgi:hypothetical protein